MGQILFAGGGGGGVNSDDLTATASQVLTGKTYVGKDTDDDAGTGTMPNIGATDNGPSLTISGSNLYCRMHNGAHITNASSGYPEVYYPLSTVRSAINYTNAAKVLNDTTICGLTGTMPSHSSGQHANSNGVNSSGIWMYIPYGYYVSEGNNQAWVYRTKDEMKSTVISAYGIASVTNFSVAQYSSQKLLFTWANPGSGKMWSGIRIVGKQSGYPSSVSDGTVICDSSAGSYTTGTLATGTWYFRAWNYITVSGGRWYGGYVQVSGSNSTISGEKTFTSGGSWTVPTAVRQIQYFLVGGGGGSGINSSSKRSRSSRGGGGGYTTSGYASVTPGQKITISIGGGGSGDGGGGTTSLSGAVSASAGGGYSGKGTGSGNGGSGGGGQGGYGGYGAGGSNGSDGGTGKNSAGGTGQHTTTHCPWDTSIDYAHGGDGGSYYDEGSFSASGPAGRGAPGTGADSNNGGAYSCSAQSGIARIRW